MCTVIRLIVVPLACLVACKGSSGSPPGAVGTGTTYTSDSVRQAQLAEFRSGLPEVRALEHGRPDRDGLARAVVGALAARDTLTLSQLALSKAEFGWLYYPTSRQALPPYDLDPATLWLTTQAQGARGSSRALERLGGQRVQYLGMSCDSIPSHEGANTLYGPCSVRVLVGERRDTSEGRIFGLVIEREGSWKLVSYANRLD